MPVPRTVLGPARWSARHPWIALSAWLVFVLVSVVVGSAVGTKQLGPADLGIGASASADRAVATAGFLTPVNENVLIQGRDSVATSTELLAAATKVADRMSALAEVEAVGQPVPSADRKTVLLPITMAIDGRTGVEASSYAKERVGALQAVTDDVASQFPDLRVEQVGAASLGGTLEKQLASDFQKAEVLSLPVTLLILLVAFGALLAAAVPVGLALTAVISAIGLSALVSQVFPVTDTLTSVILLIGMAVGVDYSLFYIRRARDERAAGRSTLDSVDVAARTSGRAVLVSGLAVIVAMAGLFLAGSPIFSSMAVGTIIVVAVAVTGSLTALPAILVLLGDRIDRPRVPFVWRLRRADGESRFWSRVLSVVLARPVASLTIGVVVLLAAAAPALTLSLKQTGATDLPRSIPALQTYDRLVAAFPDEGAQHQVVVWASSPLDKAEVDAAAAKLAAAATEAPFVAEQPEVQYAPDGRTAIVALPITGEPGSAVAHASLVDLRDRLVPAAFAGVTDGGAVEVGVTGDVASDADFSDAIAKRLPWVMAFVLLLTFVILLVAFRSLVIAVTAVVLNLISVAAAYGILVLVFQNTWAESLLGFRSNGGIVPWLPLFMFVVLFGLSMDYHVFVVSRIREAAHRGMSTIDAIRHGVTSSAGVITSAALIMVGVFAIFGTLSLLDFKQLGVGLAVAVIIDATIVRAVLLPAAMAVLGERNWYLPQFLQRLPELEATIEPAASRDGDAELQTVR